MAATKTKAPTTIAQFYRQLLTDIGAPITAGNLAVLAAWGNSEGSGFAHNNPFNTTQDIAGANENGIGGPALAAGVKNYPNLGVGLEATLTALGLGPTGGKGAVGGNPSFGYGSIVTDLRGNAPVAQTEAAISSSSWGSHPGPGTSTSSAGQTAGVQTTGIVGDITGGIGQTLLGPLGGLLGGATNSVGGGIANAITGWIDSVAIRTALVLFGAIAVIVGLAIMARGIDHGAQADEAGHQEAETDRVAQRNTPAPRSSSSSSAPRPTPAPRAASTPKSSGAGAKIGKDVESTAAGAAEAAGA